MVESRKLTQTQEQRGAGIRDKCSGAGQAGATSLSYLCICFSPNFLPDKFRCLRLYDGNQVSKKLYTSQPESVAKRIKLPHSAIKARKSGV